MDPIIFVLAAAVLIGVAFYVVAVPLLQHARRNSPTTQVSSQQERLAELLAQRDAAFQALREVNFDHRVGKITDEDFTAFEANLKQSAADALRALDRWEAETDGSLDSAMERAIRARKATLAGQAPAARDGRTCPKCGKPVLAGDKFCGKCGTKLDGTPQTVVAATGSVTCPKCGQQNQQGAKFCAKCGQPLAAEVAPAAQ